MGNHLVGVAPSQIYPVEHYLTSYTELRFDISLGSTRFLKVARAESQEGLIVVKVFAIHDPTLPLVSYKTHLDEIRIKLSSAVNCIPFQKIFLTEKSGIIMREYVKYSLYDRISTRPFLTNIEKLWITFQVLYALHQCHRVGVCHGDIKLENIAVTSWNWVLLVDFASFKPTFLPEDNPADYSYFFDTSRRRSCYVAPERFIKTVASDSSTLFNEHVCNAGDLKPAMDIFSAGCALLELWNEGHVPFDLSQLLAYRSGEYSPLKHLDRLENTVLKKLLSSMIQRIPSQRLSAELYLSQERGRLFPEYFYSFLQSYMLIFSASPILSPDEKITRLKNDIANILKLLSINVEKYSITIGTIECNQIEDVLIDKKEKDGVVIIVSLTTSCIRGLHDCSSKLQSLEVIYELARHVTEDTILDRILPYIMYLLHDNQARVKVAAINTVTKCLDLIKHVPRSDANVFPEYILPGLASLATDHNVSVRVSYAKNIANLAGIALRYLEYVQANYSNKTNSKGNYSRIYYEIELQTLHELIQQTVSALLTDTQSIVKQTLMHNGINMLCVFFGKQKSNDILLSHIITCLNDKEDNNLRSTFYDCIIGVAAFLGWQCSTILMPLLLQGLTDPSEFVCAKAIHAMASLTKLGLLSTTAVYELIGECSSFLIHPNWWIRQAISCFVCAASTTLSPLDVQCKIVPLLTPFLKYAIIQTEKPELILDALVTPIPRSVFDSVTKFNDIKLFFDMLRIRIQARNMIITARNSDFNTDSVQSIKNLIRRLEANGMTPFMETYILMMSTHMKKINFQHIEQKSTYMEGKIELSSGTSNIKNHIYALCQEQKPEYAIHGNKESIKRFPDSSNLVSSSQVASLRSASPILELDRSNQLHDPTSNTSLHEKSYIHYKRANCSVELHMLIARQEDHHLLAVRQKEWAEQTAWLPQLPPPGWKLRGTLVAHLYEHRSYIVRLASIPESSLFASASVDGYVRLWDCSKMEGRNIANRSKIQHKVDNDSSIESMTICDRGQSIATSLRNGNLTVMRLESLGQKIDPLHSHQLNVDTDGFAIDVQYLDCGSQSVIVYATLYGDVVGWDLRSPTAAWRFSNGLKQGLLTSFCIDSQQSWLTVGTSGGSHIAWDLRFHLQIANVEHPSGQRIRKIIPHPVEHSWIMSSVTGNNEISVWNLETGFRQQVFWASVNPPLSKTQISAHSVCSMLAGCVDRSGFLLSGGSDQRLRFWDLEKPQESYIAVFAPNDGTEGTMNHINYKTRLIDGTRVIYEVVESTCKTETSSINCNKGDELPRAGPESPPSGHRDCITDIAICKASQCFLLTASRDGVIKVWK